MTAPSALPPSLREPRSADYAALAGWLPDACACMRWAGPRVTFPFTVATLPTLLEVAGGSSYFLAETTGEPLAFGQHWVNTPGAVHLGRIIVAPAQRGRGFGVLLCQQLMSAARQHSGASAVTLRVYRDNTPALRTYTRLGFLPVEEASDRAVLFMKAVGGPAGAPPG